MALAEGDIQLELDKRRPGTSRHVTQRNEPDAVQILSGVFEGRTTGTPICLLIANTDQRSKDYASLLNTFRPGHADYTYWRKYGLRDPRGGGRASARLTAPMVAAGAVARKWLREQHGTRFRGGMAALGDIEIAFEGWEHVPNNPFFAPNVSQIAELEAAMDALRKAGDSVGARIRVEATNVPVGLGEPLFDKLDAEIAYAMMGINAVKGVEIGAGFASAAQRGSTHGDDLSPAGFRSNNAGGVLGGISTGQDITVQIAIKPTSSVRTPRQSIDLQGQPATVATLGRHGPLCGHSRHADRRGDAGARVDGPCAAAPRAVRRRAHCGQADPRRGADLKDPASVRNPADDLGSASPEEALPIAATPRFDFLRQRVICVLRLRGTVQHLRAVVVRQPGFQHLGDRLNRVAAKRHAPVQPVRLGLAGRSQRAAHPAAACGSRPIAAVCRGLPRRAATRLDRLDHGGAVRLHRRGDSDQRIGARASRQP